MSVSHPSKVGDISSFRVRTHLAVMKPGRQMLQDALRRYTVVHTSPCASRKLISGQTWPPEIRLDESRLGYREGRPSWAQSCGSINSEICRQVSRFIQKRIIRLGMATHPISFIGELIRKGLIVPVSRYSGLFLCRCLSSMLPSSQTRSDDGNANQKKPSKQYLGTCQR